MGPTKMVVNSANRAVHIPVLTANTIRRCNKCVVLANQKGRWIRYTGPSMRPRTREALYTYLSNIPSSCLWMSKYTIRVAIRTSSLAQIPTDNVRVYIGLFRLAIQYVSIHILYLSCCY